MHRVMGHISLCYIECAKLLIKEYALKNQYVTVFYAVGISDFGCKITTILRHMQIKSAKSAFFCRILSGIMDKAFLRSGIISRIMDKAF